MDLQKINWKIFAAEGNPPDPDVFFRVFNKWIPDSPEVFIDVADYKHVFQGPLTLLAGHYVNYAWDLADGKYGLLYSRKQPMIGSNADKIKATFIETLLSCKRLEADPELEGKVKFNPETVQFTINDRALAPNTEASFNEVLSLLKESLGTFVEDSEGLRGTPVENPQERFGVSLSLGNALTVEDLLAKA